MDIEEKKQQAETWFISLREQICSNFETLEQELSHNADNLAPAIFEKKSWTRTKSGTGGGVMSVLRGRVFEKAAIHTSTVHGEFSPQFRAEIDGTKDDPRYWATSISLIAHPLNPHVPTVHMNTRMILTQKHWFGGGADLTPMLEPRRNRTDADSKIFLNALKQACEKHHDVADYDHFKKWCDDYFYLPHRQEPRGVGGIFYDEMYFTEEENSFAKRFAFTQDVGRAFLKSYPQIVRNNFNKTWSEAEREQQMIQRGRYVEFNLLHDRGTAFGFRSGGNTEAILSSMPPTVKWP